MRLARVLIADAPSPQAALERDGCLYDVEALEESFDTRFSPARFAGAGDFAKRAITLGGAGLDELDRRLCGAERPTEARLGDGEFVWCAPFDDRGLYVQLEGGGGDGAKRFRLANPRALLGHDATIALADGETRAEVGLDVGVLLREDLRRATAAEAREAILGAAILATWTGLDELDRAPAAGRGEGAARVRAAQLGPVVVTVDELRALEDKRAKLRLGDALIHDGVVATSLDEIASAVAALSADLDLRAGDLVGAGLALAKTIVPIGAKVDLVIERLGRLTGRFTPA